MKYPNLELIEYKFLNEIEKLDENWLKYYYPNVDMDVFQQTWGSTALGFGGCGGSAITKAYTTVVCVELIHAKNMSYIKYFTGVYFDGRLAYIIEDAPTDEFFEDLKNRQMASVAKSGKYYRKAEEE